jgi:hypothetical protein
MESPPRGETDAGICRQLFDYRVASQRWTFSGNLSPAEAPDAHPGLRLANTKFLTKLETASDKGAPTPARYFPYSGSLAQPTGY